MTMGYGDQPTTGRWYVDENGDLQFEPDTGAATPQAGPYTPQGYDYYDYAPPPVVGAGRPYTPPPTIPSRGFDPVTGESIPSGYGGQYRPSPAQQKRTMANQAQAEAQAAYSAYQNGLARLAAGDYDANVEQLKAAYTAARDFARVADAEADQAEKAEAAAATAKAGTAGGWLTPNTTSQYYLQTQPDGSVRQIANPNYVPPGSAPGSAAALQNAQTAAQTLAWNMARQAAQDRIAQEQYQQTHNWQLEAAERLRQQQVADAQALAAARQRETQMARAQDLASMYQNAQIQSLPYMARPGQVYYTGGEPGGFFEQVMKRTGTTYRPEDFRAPIVNIDPYAAWRDAIAAMQQTAQQQGGGQ